MPATKKRIHIKLWKREFFGEGIFAAGSRYYCFCLSALFVTERIINMFINISRRLPGENNKLRADGRTACCNMLHATFISATGGKKAKIEIPKKEGKLK